ncbi:hypothetical protein VTH06DRAFT_185 [Thermothelomyces fergusii]
MIDTSLFHLSADAQSSSPFFAVLPAEIRDLVYIEFWKLSSARLHVVKRQVIREISPDQDAENPWEDEWLHVPCIIDPRVEESRWGEVTGKQSKSEWCIHWPCEEQFPPVKAIRHGQSGAEASASRPIPGQTGFLNLLTTCKRMYLEALPSLYGNTTFILTDTRTAGEFLARYGADGARHPFRSLELCIRLPNLLTEIYYPPAHGSGKGDEGPPAVFAGRHARPALTAANNPWQRLCDALVALPALQQLRVWLDSSDLRPWHKRVSETRLLGRLADVRGLDKSRFVLGLPELPARRGPDSHALQGQYLEGAKLDEVPFTVQRGPRPNNWRNHLHHILSLGAAALALPAPPGAMLVHHPHPV